MKRTVIRDLKKQLTALDEFFKDNKQDVSEYIDERLSWDDQDRFVLQYSSHPQTYLGYKHKEEPISDSITYDTHRIRDFSQFVVAG